MEVKAFMVVGKTNKRSIYIANIKKKKLVTQLNTKFRAETVQVTRKQSENQGFTHTVPMTSFTSTDANSHDREGKLTVAIRKSRGMIVSCI